MKQKFRAGPCIACLGLWLVCQIVIVEPARAQSGSDVPPGLQAQSEVLAPRAVNILPRNILPARYTLGSGMAQSMALAEGDARLTRIAAADGPVERTVNRPRVVIPLYISMAVLQGLDVVSTRRALMAGGREANPLVAPFVESTPSLFALKAGVYSATVFACERLWKQNRKAAILTLIGTNVGYAAVVAHNLAVAARASGTR